MADQQVYHIEGKATNEAERCASENMADNHFSSTRQLRFKLYQWPNEGVIGMLAVLQYDFVNAAPAGSCWSIGLLVHLRKEGLVWHTRDQFLIMPQHHGSINLEKAVGWA